MVQEAKELGVRIGKETPQFRIGGKVIAVTARVLGRLNLLPGSLRDGQAAEDPQRPETENRLRQAVAEFNTQPHTPELITRTFQAIWQARGELVGATYEVTPCPYTQEQLDDLEANGRRVGYLPGETSTRQTRHVLGKMFPAMQSHSVQEGNPVTNDKNPSGWFDYEAAIDASDLDTIEEQLMERVNADGKTLLNLNQYIVAAQDSKLFTLQYLDEARTWVRLGSRFDGCVVDAHFVADGRLFVDWDLPPDNHGPHLGGRSSGVKKS